MIRIEVNQEYKEKMEKILTDKESIFDNFDVLFSLNPKNTIHFCGKLLTKPKKEELKQSDQLVQEMR